MNAEVIGVIEDLKKGIGRLGTIEKVIEELSKANGDQGDRIRKVLASGNAVGGAGWDGDNTMSLFEVFRGRKQKALGCGSFLEAVEAAGRGRGIDEIEKSLEKMGSLPVKKTALATTSGAQGGYTLPIQFVNELYRLMGEESFMWNLCFKLPMTAREAWIPALAQTGNPTAGSSSFYSGVQLTWQPEGASITEKEPTMRQVKIVNNDLVMVLVASNQLMQDNAVGMDTIITTLLKEAAAWAADYYTLRGNGSAGQPIGIVTSVSTGPTLLQNRNATGLNMVDVANMATRYWGKWSDAVWICNRFVLQDLIQMVDSTNGRLVWLNQAPAQSAKDGGPLAQEIPMTLLGAPIILTEKLPARGTSGDVLLIDPTKYVIGDRMGIQIESSPYAGTMFQTNQTMWRAIVRFGGQPWPDGQIVLADGGNLEKVSPFIQLN